MSQSSKYCSKIQGWLEEMTKLKIKLNPETLLGISEPTWSKKQQHLILHIITVARIAFAQNWKLTMVPTDLAVINKIYQCAEMIILTKLLKNKEEGEFFTTWNTWYKWLNEKEIKMYSENDEKKYHGTTEIRINV
uniref:Uncharacterized protein n=1 Tax=Micrurus spixii TaxID=129469 RepID=A0A2D4LQH5_9SAUR